LKATEFVVDEREVVREKQRSDPPAQGFLLYDLEGELFFGAGAELDHAFERILLRAREEAIDHVMLRLKRVRHPDVAALEHFEHFLKQAPRQNVTAWLAGIQPDLLDSFQRLDFFSWLPKNQVFARGADKDSAAVAVIRAIRGRLTPPTSAPRDRLYYLV
jgi:SulP family sulfate permease